jgi:hypothetical protein
MARSVFDFLAEAGRDELPRPFGCSTTDLDLCRGIDTSAGLPTKESPRVGESSDALGSGAASGDPGAVCVGFLVVAMPMTPRLCA